MSFMDVFKDIFLRQKYDMIVATIREGIDTTRLRTCMNPLSPVYVLIIFDVFWG